MPDYTTFGHVVTAFRRSLISTQVLADAHLKTDFTRRGVFVAENDGDPDIIIKGGRDTNGQFELPLEFDIVSITTSWL